MHKTVLLTLSCLVIQCVHSQYVSFQQQAPPSTNICAGNTSLVEHFFNLIFSEFHNHPPVCVCVQMCPEQPTYCYPNGCFKKAEPPSKTQSNPAVTTRYQPTAQVSQLQQDNTQPMSFLVDGQSNFMDNLLNSKSGDAKQASKYDDPNSYKEMRRDPFEDRYQSIFKYKKTPKVHLRYNLREQVRHKKSDIIKIEKIDVSKTRWPVTVSDSKQYYIEKDNKDNKYFHNLENGNTPHYPTKFFKRDVTKLFKSKENNYDEVENTTEIASFSLENLIENLIESSFGPLTNDTELDLNVNLDYAVVNNATTIEPITMPYNKRSIVNKNTLLNKNTMIILNETTSVVSINNTNQNTNENRYRDDEVKDQIYKNVFNDMIASLSRHIEKNNNSSIEMMEHVLGRQIEDVSTNTEMADTTQELKEELQSDLTTSIESIAENAISETTTQVPVETKAPEKEIVSTEKEMEREHLNLMRKSHRRILRKSHNNKPN